MEYILIKVNVIGMYFKTVKSFLFPGNPGVLAGIDPPSNAVWGAYDIGWLTFALTGTRQAFLNQYKENVQLPLACQRDY